MEIRDLHPWNVSPREAVHIQERLSPFLSLKKLTGPIRHVAGADVSCSRNSDTLWAGISVFSFPDLIKVEERWVKGKALFPYIPGLLSFRELPAIINCVEKLETAPDLILCDGHGTAHPRSLGLASHLGLLIDKATIGCAKTRLTGEFSEVGPQKGDNSELRREGEVIGAALRTRAGVKPMFISPGNRITLKESLEVVIACCLKYRIPEPVRQAHRLVNTLRQSAISE